MPTKPIGWEANDLDWADGYLKLTRLIVVPAIRAYRLGQHTAELMMKISLAGGAATWLESKGIAPQPAGLVQLEPFFGKVANFCMYYANGSVSEKLAFAFIDDGAFDTAYSSNACHPSLIIDTLAEAFTRRHTVYRHHAPAFDESRWYKFYSRMMLHACDVLKLKPEDIESVKRRHLCETNLGESDAQGQTP